jgi:hypothetical protein
MRAQKIISLDLTKENWSWFILPLGTQSKLPFQKPLSGNNNINRFY